MTALPIERRETEQNYIHVQNTQCLRLLVYHLTEIILFKILMEKKRASIRTNINRTTVYVCIKNQCLCLPVKQLTKIILTILFEKKLKIEQFNRHCKMIDFFTKVL